MTSILQSSLTEKLKLSVAIELLNSRIATMEAHFAIDPSMYSYEDWLDFILSAKFLNEHADKSYSVIEVEQYLQTLES